MFIILCLLPGDISFLFLFATTDEDDDEDDDEDEDDDSGDSATNSDTTGEGGADGWDAFIVS